MASPQLSLIPYENPLAGRLGAEFFRRLPRTPGVYVMYGLAGAVLYVGKAKNLRARLASYRRARPDQVSRKVIRLIHVVDEIRYETCETEAGALIRENELLRLHKPSFNVVNKSPESYYFIGVRGREGLGGRRSLELRLTTHPDFGPDWAKESFFGAFKGRRSVRDSYQALLRLLWASQARQPRFEYPGALTGRRVPYRFELSLDAEADARAAREWCALARRYLKGTSDELLKKLTGELLANANIPPFHYRSIQEDLERLQSFYSFGPQRNRRIRAELGIADPLIPQELIDDLLVRYKERKQLRF